MATPQQAFALRVDPNRAAREEEFRADLNVRLVCPDCQEENPNLIEEFGSGDLVCGGCGLVLGDKIVDTRSEWRTFANDEGDDPSRVGGPTDPLLDSSEQFATLISFRDGNTGVAKALQMAASRVSKDGSSNAQKMQNAFRDISNMCDTISLPRTIVDTSKQLFKRVDEEKLLKGKPLDAVIAACIFIACRQGRVPRTFKEICALTNVEKKDIGRCFKAIEQAFETAVPGATASTPAPSSAEALITRFCNHLGLPVPVQQAALTVVIKVNEDGILAGRSPITIAGACIYFATHLWGQGKSGKEIALVAGVQESTIRVAYKQIYGIKEKIVDERWFESGRAKWENLG